MLSDGEYSKGGAAELVAYVKEGLPAEARFILIVALPIGPGPAGTGVPCVIATCGNAPSPINLVRQWLVAQELPAREDPGQASVPG